MKNQSYRRPFFQMILSLFTRTETAINHVWGERWNFFYYLGSLPIVLLFVLLITGLFMFIYYNMSVTSSYESVQYMTEHAPLGRFMRNLHRYAADAMMFFVILHMLRVLLEEKFQNHRTLAWVSGLIILLLMLVQGLTGYILPLDSTARFVMEKTSEILAGMKVFGDTLPRSFSSPALLGKWIMWVVLIVHLIIPLFFILLLFIHLLRVSRAKLFPPKKLTIAFVLLLAVYTIVFPLPMAGRAEAEKLPQLLQPDWFYLFFAPLFENRIGVYIWISMALTLLLLFAAPWLARRRQIAVAQVVADKCTGCGLCATDCPYQAMHMIERSSALAAAANGSGAGSEATHRHKFLVSIETSLCAGCGVCAGSCAYDAIRFEEEPAQPGEEVRGKWVALVCQSRAHTLRLANGQGADPVFNDSSLRVQVVQCSGKLGPSWAGQFRSAGAKGIIVGACPDGDCWYREGNAWLRDRLAQQRKPRFPSAWLTPPEKAGSENPVPEFPILGLRFTGAQKKDFAAALSGIVRENRYRHKTIPQRMMEFLKPSQWAYSFSFSTLVLASLLWVFFVGSSAKFGAVTGEAGTAMIRLDFFYQTDKQTCSPDQIPAGAEQAALERMAGLVKLDNLTPEARERMLRQARDSVAGKYCSRARRPIEVTITVDGVPGVSRIFKPSGFQNDGITYVLLKHATVPGEHIVGISAREVDPAGQGRETKFSEKFTFASREVKLIDFEPNAAKFFLRTTKPAENATGKE